MEENFGFRRGYLEVKGTSMANEKMGGGTQGGEYIIPLCHLIVTCADWISPHALSPKFSSPL